MKTKKEKSATRFLFPALILGMAATRFASGGGGYDQICVPVTDKTAQCVATNKVEKFLSGVGVQSIALPPGDGDSLLVCDDGLLFDSEVGEDMGDGVFRMDVPQPWCKVPKKPKGSKLYGPKMGLGGKFCNGRTTPDSCKDCCLSVGLAQGAMVAAAGKMYRDTKPGPNGLAADAVAEVASYGLIYWARHNCDDNCEISYEMTERKLR
jgi:hypothetical protein